MPERSSNRTDDPKKPTKKQTGRKDVNQLAASILARATGDAAPEDPEPEQSTPEDDGKNPAAVALGKLGGKKGGPARAKKLSPEQRSKIAKKAAKARWEKEKREDDQ